MLLRVIVEPGTLSHLIQATILRLSSGLDAASRQRWTAQFPNLVKGSGQPETSHVRVALPMGHHFIAASADSVYNLDTFLRIRYFKFLLEEDRCLLIRRLDYTVDKD